MSNSNTKKKQQFSLYASQLLIGGIIGFCIGLFLAFKPFNIPPFSNLLLNIVYFCGVLLSLFFAYLFQILIHEGGHLIFGILTGYKFVSFRILNYLIVKENDHIELKRYNVAGTLGQCLLAPPEWNDNFPYVLYNLGGVIMNVVSAIITIALFILIPYMPVLSEFLFISTLLALVFAASNGIPIPSSGATTDGNNLYYMKKDLNARRALYQQLEIHNKILQEIRIKDIPDELFDIPDNADISNPLISAIKVNKLNKLFDIGNYQQAKHEIEDILKIETLPLLLENEIKCEQLFIELITDCQKDIIDKLYNKKLRQYIKVTKNYPSRQRLLYAYYLLYKNDSESANNHLNIFHKSCKKFPYKSEIESELEVLAEINKIYNSK